MYSQTLRSYTTFGRESRKLKVVSDRATQRFMDLKILSFILELRDSEMLLKQVTLIFLSENCSLKVETHFEETVHGINSIAKALAPLDDMAIALGTESEA